MKVSYSRVSSSGQSLEIQLDALKKFGCEKHFQEKVSGTSTQGRSQLKECLDFVREGDELVITRIDRLARSVLDLQLIVKELTDKGVTLTATEQPISTKDATSKCFLDMLGVFAELETNLRKERQIEGIARAKEKGVYKGRRSKIDVDQIKTLKSEGLGATAIAKQLNIHRDSVYRLLKEAAS
ncbi:MAG: recombinase family protein [Candidatus Woesearchaeota archaeon]|jgi:DNA invertase Pin-like site-specific DNA recombinase|nr:recombinase family protein [Candidatus Woesearchaeota archaeon]